MIQLNLEVQEVNTILQILQETPLPWKVSNPLLNKIAEQSQAAVAKRKAKENKKMAPDA